MHGEVIVSFGPQREQRYALQVAQDAQTARAWLDEQYLALECEPLRASGKVLVADKLLTIADAAGESLCADPQWGPRFAEAALAATQREFVRIDLAARTVGY